MRRENVLTLGELEQHAQHIPEIDPSAVMAMLDVIQASAEIQHAIFDILEQEYQLSEGKLCAMIILHQQPDGMAPSKLAARAGVTRATISAMLHRMNPSSATLRIWTGYLLGSVLLAFYGGRV